MKIEVQGVKARLFVHDSEPPTLVVNDLKQGDAKGAIALWIGPGTVAHFSNLHAVTLAKKPRHQEPESIFITM